MLHRIRFSNFISVETSLTFFQVTREVQQASKFVLYFPMEPQLYRLMTSPSTARYFKAGTGLRKPSSDNRVRGLKDSKLWKEKVLDTNFSEKEGNVVLMSSGDGAQVWKGKKKGKVSLFFLGSEVCNLPYKLMSKHRIIHAVWPGPGADREQVQVLLRNIYVPEMVWNLSHKYPALAL